MLLDFSRKRCVAMFDIKQYLNFVSSILFHLKRSRFSKVIVRFPLLCRNKDFLSNITICIARNFDRQYLLILLKHTVNMMLHRLTIDISPKKLPAWKSHHE